MLSEILDTVETVTPYLIEGILNAKHNDEVVRCLTPWKIRRRKPESLLKKRDVVTPLGLWSIAPSGKLIIRPQRIRCFL